MKLHLPKSLLVAALVAMSAVSSYAAEYTVGTMSGGKNYPSKSGNIESFDGSEDGTDDGVLTLTGSDWLGAKDANGKLITSFGRQTWEAEMTGFLKWTWKDVDASNGVSAVVTKNAQFGTLSINDNAQVVLGGQYRSNQDELGALSRIAEYTGVIADHVEVSGNGTVTNLNTWNLTTNTLVVNSGKVKIHTAVQSGNNHFAYELRDSKQVRIHEGLTVNGGEVIININSLTDYSKADDTHVFTGFGTINFDAPSYEEGSIVDASKASIVKSWITQSNGSLVIEGKTASVGGLNINQTGGSMSVSTNAAGTGNHCWHILSDFGDSSINQDGGEGTVLNIGGIAAYNSKYSDIKDLMNDKGVVFDPLKNEAEYNGEVMDLNASVSISQAGSGTINIIQGIDLNNYHENKNGVASTQKSTISQSGGGVINLGGTYKGASFDINQNGNGGVINLKGSMTAGTVTQTAGTINVAKNASMSADSVSVGGVLEVKDGGTLTAGAIKVTEGGKLVNNGVISNASTAMLAADDDSMLIIVAGGSVENFGTTDKAILVQDGGVLTLGDGSSVGAVTMEQDGDISISGTAVTGALTLTGGTITFTEGAMLEITDGMNVTITDAVTIEVKLSDAALENVMNGDYYDLFKVTEGDTSAVTTVLNGATVSFVSTSNADNRVDAVVQQNGGAVKIETLVPEPTTATLSLLALAALAARRRRK